MKKIVLLCLSFLVFTSFSAIGKGSEFNFVGKWIGTDKGTTGGFIFDEEGYVIMIKEGMTMGGKNFDIQGKKGNLKYTINQNVNPIELDLTMEEIETGKKKKMLFAVKVIDSNHIVIAMEDDGQRPVGFTDDNSITLTRQ